MKLTLTALALLPGLPLAVAACLWDRDTPANEAKGMPEVVAVLTGRLERNPPRFYEMILTGVTPRLQHRVDDLAAYAAAGAIAFDDRPGLWRAI